MNKREMLLLSMGGTALALSGCTQPQLDVIEKQFADVITQVQAGVKTACASVGANVPTANSVLSVLIAILGSTSVAGVTAAVIQEAINTIAAACQSTQPPAAKRGITVNGKSVEVVFY